jgi:hypothetical protein
MDPTLKRRTEGRKAAPQPGLDPDVVLRIEGGAAPGASRLIRGARAVAERASGGARAGRQARMALVNGATGSDPPTW